MALPESLLADMADPAWWAGYLPDYRELDAGYHGADTPVWFKDRPPVDLPVGGGYGLRLGGRYGFWFHLLELTGPGSEPGTLGSDDGAHPFPHVFRWDEFDLVCRAMALNDPATRYPGPAAALLCRFAFLSEEEDLDAVTPVLDASLHATRPQALGIRGTWPGAGHWLRMRDLRGTGVTWHRDEAGNLTADQDDQQRFDTLWPLYTFRHRGEPDAVAARDDGCGTDEDRGPDDGFGEFPWPAWRAMLAAAEQTLTRAADPAWRADSRISAHLGDLLAGELRSGPVLAALLAQAGCDHPTVLRALREPVHPLETVWVAELLTGVPRGSLIAGHCGPSPFHPQRSRELTLRFDLDSESLARFRELVLELDAALRCRRQGDAMGFAYSHAAMAAGASIGRGQASITLVGDVEAARRTVDEVLARRSAGIGLIAGGGHGRDGRDTSLEQPSVGL